jgi:hypothetical protein
MGPGAPSKAHSFLLLGPPSKVSRDSQNSAKLGTNVQHMSLEETFYIQTTTHGRHSCMYGSPRWSFSFVTVLTF